MADITTDINQIKQADYGEDVRDNIVDALTKMNQETEAASKAAATAEQKVAGIAIDDDGAKVSIMQGASGTNDGKSGLTPQPKIGDQEKFLRGDGTWAAVAFTGEVDLTKIPVFDVNKSGLTPGPSDDDPQTFLAADGKWHKIQPGSTSSDTGTTGDDSKDTENNLQEPIKFFTAKRSTTYNDEDGLIIPCIEIRFDFQRWHYVGANGKDYPITEVILARRTDGYVKNENTLNGSKKVKDINLTYPKKGDDIDYSQRPDDVDELHTYVGNNPIKDTDISYGNIYYYSLVLILHSPVSNKLVTHYNHQNNHVRILIPQKFAGAFESDDLDTIAANIQKCQRGEANLDNIYNDKSINITGIFDADDAALFSDCCDDVNISFHPGIKVQLILIKDMALYTLADGNFPNSCLLVVFTRWPVSFYINKGSSANINWSNCKLRTAINRLFKGDGGNLSKFLGKVSKPFNNTYDRYYKGPIYSIIDYGSLLNLKEHALLASIYANNSGTYVYPKYNAISNKYLFSKNSYSSYDVLEPSYVLRDAANSDNEINGKFIVWWTESPELDDGITTPSGNDAYSLSVDSLPSKDYPNYINFMDQITFPCLFCMI